MDSLTQEEQDKKQNQQQFIVFKIGREEYGVDINRTKEILKPTKITNVPDTADYILGVINLRGQIVPVVDLHKKFKIDVKKSRNGQQRIITIEIKDTLIGLLVDGIKEVVWLSKDEIEPAPEMAGGIKQEFLEGVGRIEDQLLILINLDKLLFAKKEYE